MKKGFLITFEGPEGAGKSTQIKTVVDFLKKKKRSVLRLREPGGTTIGEGIREILLDKTHKKMACETELLLYLAARAQIVKEKILPALRKGQIVICDRFEDSTIAYQGFGRNIPLEIIENASCVARGDLKPDLTFILDIDIKKGLARGGRHDRIEKEAFSFHEKVREGFLWIAKKNPKRVTLLDAALPIDVISQKVRERLERVFDK